MGSKVRRQRLPASPKEAFSRHASPERWGEWMADLVGAPKVEGDGGPGTIVSVKNRVFGLPQPATVRVTKHDAGEDGGSWEGSIEGLIFTATERATFLPDPAGTYFEWRWDYDPKIGSSGGLIDKLVGRVVNKHMDACLRELQAGD